MLSFWKVEPIHFLSSVGPTCSAVGSNFTPENCITLRANLSRLFYSEKIVESCVTLRDDIGAISSAYTVRFLVGTVDIFNELEVPQVWSSLTSGIRLRALLETSGKPRR